MNTSSAIMKYGNIGCSIVFQWRLLNRDSEGLEKRRE